MPNSTGLLWSHIHLLLVHISISHRYLRPLYTFRYLWLLKIPYVQLLISCIPKMVRSSSGTFPKLFQLFFYSDGRIVLPWLLEVRCGHVTSFGESDECYFQEESLRAHAYVFWVSWLCLLLSMICGGLFLFQNCTKNRELAIRHVGCSK